MGHVLERVLARFPDADPSSVRSLVEQEHHQYDGRPIREFVPVLVEREVNHVLQVARQRGPSELPPAPVKNLVPQ